MPPDAIARWGDELRRRRQLDDARRVALRGLERHPYLPDAHDLLARICADLGDEQRARDEWEMALELDPAHLPSLKGLGFLAWRRRDLAGAERFLRAARERDPGDGGLETALRRVEEALRLPATSAPASPRANGGTPARGNGAVTSPATPAAPAPALEAHALFAPLLGDGDCTALLLDRDGLVLAGVYVDESGHDVGDAVGAVLSGLGEEAARALEQLDLGAWESLLVEAPHANVALGPVRDGAVALVAAGSEARVGFVRRLLDRVRRRATTWLEAA